MTTDRQTAPTAPVTRDRSGALPSAAEGLAPWLGGAALVGALVLGALIRRGGALSIAGVAPLLIGLTATVSVAGMVAVRSSRAAAARDREERARPAPEELEPVARVRDEAIGTRSYLVGMEQWTTALLELLDHATEASEDPRVRAELATARDDTDALRSLLREGKRRDLPLNEVATLHSVCRMWESGQPRIEEMAAQADPGWHRRWRGRSVVERLLRHGPPVEPTTELPYQD